MNTVDVRATSRRGMTFRFYEGERSQCPRIPDVGEDIKGSFPDGFVTGIMYLPKGTDEQTCTAILIHFDECYPNSRSFPDAAKAAPLPEPPAATCASRLWCKQHAGTG
jgi:hypothetical protein